MKSIFYNVMENTRIYNSYSLTFKPPYLKPRAMSANPRVRRLPSPAPAIAWINGSIGAAEAMNHSPLSHFPSSTSHQRQHLPLLAVL